MQFDPLNSSHFSLLHRWFNQPHVQEFYSLRDWTLEQVDQKLRSLIEPDSTVHAYVAMFCDKPLGYFQYYPLSNHPWPDQQLAPAIIERGAGVDLFIGEPDYLGQGFGRTLTLAGITQLVWPQFEYCAVDPDVRNTTSIRMFVSCGFRCHRIISTVDALGRPVELQLMLLERATS